MECFRDIFGEASNADPKPQIRNAARAYLLYILGYTLFTDKSGTRVLVIYLRLLMDLDEVRTYALGDAVLAYLCRQLVSIITGLLQPLVHGSSALGASLGSPERVCRLHVSFTDTLRGL